MLSFRKIASLSLGVLYLSGCVVSNNHAYYTGEVDSCGFSLDARTHKPVKWDTKDFPINFYIHESVPEEAQENFVASIDHWNESWRLYSEQNNLEYKPLFALVANGSLFTGEVDNDSYNMLFFADDFSGFGEKTVQAVTKIFSKQRRIRDTDIIVNNSDFSYFYDTSYNQSVVSYKSQREAYRSMASTRLPTFVEKIKNSLLAAVNFFLDFFRPKKERELAGVQRARVPKRHVDFPSLMIHELGHVPGLAHATGHSHRSVMEAKLPYGVARRSIGSYDLDNLYCGYLRK